MMECTQRLECTQDTYNVCSERTCPEQIGLLGICGSKQPIKKGPNKVGRDPQTCSIVLNDNSISRHHAVINILNKRDFMLMDLDSSNKTKLQGKTLEPYIPHPLRNGDTVQFGQVFGIFRLLEEDDDLPMTQAVEIPETPFVTRHVSRLKTAPITTVPESPDVSDRDESIIAQQQARKKTDLKSPNNNFIKSSERFTETEQLATNKIDNVYWKSSKKSDSFSTNFNSNSSYIVNKNSISPKKLIIEDSIYDMDTQAPALPGVDLTSNSIYEANTQVVTPNIYNCETQVSSTEKLPEAYRVLDQSDVQLNLYSTKGNVTINQVDTKVSCQDKHKMVSLTLCNAKATDSQDCSTVSSIDKKLNNSDEEICFDEIDCQQFESECGSQPLLPPDSHDFEIPVIPSKNTGKTKLNIIEKTENTSGALLYHANSKNCEDIASSQLVSRKSVITDEDVTDCEDNMLELAVSIADRPNKIQSDDDITDCEDDLNDVNDKQKTGVDDDLTDCEDDVIEVSQNRSKTSNIYQNFEDLPTQVIGAAENFNKEKKPESEKHDVPFEDMLTQVIEEYPVASNVIANAVNKADNQLQDLQTQISNVRIPQQQSSSSANLIKNNDSFKCPLSSPTLKKGDATSLKITNPRKVVIKKPESEKDDVPFEDMLTQVIEEYPVASNVIANAVNKAGNQLQDLQTQISNVRIPQQQSSSSAILIKNYDSFKCPLSSPTSKKGDATSLKITNPRKVVIKKSNLQKQADDDENYYEATQQIMNDLCTQGENGDNYPCPQVEQNYLSTEKNVTIKKRSPEGSVGAKRINSSILNLTKEQVQEEIGADVCDSRLLKKKSTDSSDLEVTPKKFNHTKLLTVDTQEIKSSNLVSSKVDDRDSSSSVGKLSSAVGRFSGRKRRKKDIKMDLIQKFDTKPIPSEANTSRIFKSRSKILDCNNTIKNLSEKNPEVKLGLGKEHGVLDSSLKRLDNKMEKVRNKAGSSSRKAYKDDKDVILEHVELGKNWRKSSNQIKESEVQTLPSQNNVTESKQQIVKSMFKEPTSKNVSAVEVCSNAETEPIDSAHKSRRSSRNKGKGDKKEKTEMAVKEMRLEYSERKKSSSRSKSSSKPVKDINNLTENEEIVVRRSKRQRRTNDKEKKESNKYEILDTPALNNKKNNTSLNNELSTVYNLSSETATESPISLKRQATTDIVLTKAKRVKTSKAIRAIPSRGVRTQYVLFTAFPIEAVKLKLEKLGAVMVSDVKTCTVVLTLKIKRTFKLLCALGLGKPIVGPNWVQACADSNMIVDPWLYLLKDEATERRFGFNLRQSLTSKRNFLKGYNVSCTPNVAPESLEMKSIVECSGGTWKEGGRNWFCVSSSTDKALWPGLRKRGATLVSSEFILGGVLQQKIIVDSARLP